MKTSFVVATAGLACCLSLAVPAAYAQDKPSDTKIIVKDDTTPKVKKGAKAVSDESITSAVKTHLMKDKVARGSSIDVDTKEGVVTLSGAVPTEADKARIGRLAKHTTGVKSVENELNVSGSVAGTTGHKGDVSIPVPDKGDVKHGTEKVVGASKTVGEKIEDGAITTEVKTRLMKDDVARGTHIDVSTTDGVVTIAGTVPTEADKLRIGQLVEHTTGVQRVVNNLKVDR